VHGNKNVEYSAEEYSAKQDQENAAIDNRKAQYEALVPDAVSDYCELVLSASEYPDSFPKEFELEYISGTKILVVDYSLPAPEHLPRVKEVKYVKAKDDMVEVLLSETELNCIYDSTLYQICLRTIHELFDADVANALSAVVFNGWVKSIDKATGKEVNGCVISVQTTKEEFQKIELANVDPKACFKTLKGIGSSKLHSLTPIAPVLKISREDKRFIASYAVAGQLDERTNLAAMDWEDFEHLIRELFEKEFSKPGCEVKVTQASRDGGVDSVVLDSDPIHGGKTVIQAKRYTNTVGVAAVRELWGTVLNEGAMKGILVTTADYGPDAYEFAKGKPLVLLNGANLLHLLEKHGHKAKIDIQEAKRILGEKASVFHP
jgi:restriction system protein